MRAHRFVLPVLLILSLLSAGTVSAANQPDELKFSTPVEVHPDSTPADILMQSDNYKDGALTFGGHDFEFDAHGHAVLKRPEGNFLCRWFGIFCPGLTLGQITITREQAQEMALRKVLPFVHAEMVKDTGRVLPVLAFSWPEPLPAGTVVHQEEERNMPLNVFTDSWFFLFDLEPHAYFPHRAEFVAIDANTGEMLHQRAFSAPVIDGEVRYFDLNGRFASEDRFYPEKIELLPPAGKWPLKFESKQPKLPPAPPAGMSAPQSAVPSAPNVERAEYSVIDGLLVPKAFADTPVGNAADPCQGQPSKKVAIIIAGEGPNSHRTDGMDDGSNFAYDVAATKVMLRNLGFASGDVHEFNPENTPNLSDVFARARSLTQDLGPCDKFYFYLIGHGSIVDENGDGVPDEPSGSIIYGIGETKKRIGKNRYGDESIITFLEGVHAGKINLVIDSCFSGSMQTHVVQDAANPAEGTTWNVFTASDANTPSYGNSSRPGGRYTEGLTYCVNLKMAERGITNPSVAQMEALMRECQDEMAASPEDKLAPQAMSSVGHMTITLSPDVSIQEGDSGVRYAEFTITRSPSDRPMSIRHMTFDPQPDNPDLTQYGGPRDYQWNKDGSSIDFAPGESTKVIGIAIYGDTEPEGDERFGVWFPALGFRYVTIIDDDRPVTPPASSSSTATAVDGGATITITFDNPITLKPGDVIDLGYWVLDEVKKKEGGAGGLEWGGGITIGDDYGPVIIEPRDEDIIVTKLDIKITCPICEEIKQKILMQQAICDMIRQDMADVEEMMEDLGRQITSAEKDLRSTENALNNFNNPKSSASSNGRTIDSSDLAAGRRWSRGLWNDYRNGDLTAQELEAKWREGLSDEERAKIKDEMRGELEDAVKNAKDALNNLRDNLKDMQEMLEGLRMLRKECDEELRRLMAELEECEKTCKTATIGGETGGETSGQTSGETGGETGGGSEGSLSSEPKETPSTPETRCPLCEELVEQIKEKAQECQDIADDLDDAKSELKQLDSDISSAEKSIKGAEDALNNFNNPKSSASSNGRTIDSSDLAAGREWARGLWGEYRSGNMTAQDLEAAWSRGMSDAERKEMKEKIKDRLESDVQKAKDKLKDLQKEREELEQEIEDLQADLDDCDDELADLLAELEECEKQCVEEEDDNGGDDSGDHSGDDGGDTDGDTDGDQSSVSSSKSSSSSKTSSSSSKTSSSVGLRCPPPSMEGQACKDSCEKTGKGECVGVTGQGCYECKEKYAPECPNGTTPNRYECEEFCGHEGGTCAEDTKGCWSCTVAQCPSGTYKNECPSSCTSGCDVVGEQGSTQCLQCKKACTEVCSENSYVQVGTNWNSYIQSQLNQYTCVSSASVSIERATIGSCTCSNQPTVEIDSTPPVCKGTPCGDVTCNQSKSCTVGDTTYEVSCNWGGWKNIGENQFQPIVGQ